MKIISPKFAVAAAVLVASVAMAAAQSGEQRGSDVIHRDPLMGTWIVTVTPDGGGSPFTTINNFNAGGDFVQLDSRANIPGLGQWVRESDLTYSFQIIAFVFSMGTLSSTVTVHVNITLDEDLETFAGTYVFQQVDPNGHVIASGGGTRQGVRATFAFQ